MPKLARQLVVDRVELLEARHFSIGSKWIYGEDQRLDATTYAKGAFLALDAIEACKVPKIPLGRLCGTIWHPVQTQARSNFKRIYTGREYGVPFVSSREMFFMPLRPSRFLSKRMPKLRDLMVPEGWLLLSRSGTVGNVLYANKRLAACAISDHAIRIEPKKVEAGYLYALLASRFGQALIEKGIYGATVDELEPKHIASIPVPQFRPVLRQAIHGLIVNAYRLRDEANALLEEAESRLHDALNVPPFSEYDIEYLGRAGEPRAFTVSSRDMGERFDATNHVPLTRSVIRKLQKGRFPLVPLGELCSTVFIPPRFKRNYVMQEHGIPYLLPSQLFTIRPYEMKALSRRQAERGLEYLLTEGHLLVTTDGTVGRVHPVTSRMVGWFGSNNMARVWDAATDMGFLYAFLATPFGMHQMSKEIYGGVVDHISEAHVKSVLCPKVPLDIQRDIGQLVRYAFKKKDDANDLEDEALADMENAISGGDLEDLADARVARQRLGELRDGKESLISGEALRERLNQLED